jgi:hypothetical protein
MLKIYSDLPIEEVWTLKTNYHGNSSGSLQALPISVSAASGTG